LPACVKQETTVEEIIEQLIETHLYFQ